MPSLSIALWSIHEAASRSEFGWVFGVGFFR